MDILEDMAVELKAIAGSIIVLSSTVQPIQRTDDNVSAEMTESAFDSIYHHLVRVADALNTIQAQG